MRRQFSATCGVFMCSSPKWGILSILKFGRSREQHVADSFNHSLYLFKNCSTPATWGKQAERNVTICTSVSSRDSTKMCTHQAQFTIFRVLTCLLLLGVRCMCVVWVCAVCLWCVIGVLFVCLVVCVGVRRCVWLCVCGCGVSHTLSRSRFSKTCWCKRSVWKVLETATRSKKTWNHCGRSKASKSRHHGKDFVFPW